MNFYIVKGEGLVEDKKQKWILYSDRSFSLFSVAKLCNWQHYQVFFRYSV